MQIKYHEWECVGCNRTTRFTGRDPLTPVPYWFTIKTERSVSSSERPSFNTSACSIPCLEKASEIIDDSIENGKFSIPNKKKIEATICDQCAKVVKTDRLNQIIGSEPYQDWTWEKTPDGRKDFCSPECKKNHSTHPEEFFFSNLNFGQPWDKARLIEAIDSLNLRKTLTSQTKSAEDCSGLV